MEANAASVALIADGQVLLIQRAFEPLKGLWTLPGGRREAGEGIEDCGRREIFEELGLIARDLSHVIAMDVAGGRFRLQVFATTEFAGEIAPSPEVDGWQWVTLPLDDALPVTPGLEDALRRALAAVGDGRAFRADR
jgi:8-oxo-dGTP diphosphatase